MTDRVVCVDFDGVIHEYTQWDGNPPKGQPIKGIQSGLLRLKIAGCRVVVFSARESKYVQAWLVQHGLDGLIDDVTNVKIPADAYFDDRAVWVPSNLPNGLDASVTAFIRNGGLTS